jgi:hypothetical protein
LDDLEDFGTVDALFLARGEEVNPYRPIFTGDVFQPSTGGCVIVLAHPCTFRGAGAQLAESVLVAEVHLMSSPPPTAKWRSGYFRQMPLPELDHQYQAADFSSINSIATVTLDLDKRIACLSQFGVNLLQQRLVFHLTRFVASTRDLDVAFSHTYAEAELLEDWVEAQSSKGIDVPDATTAFEKRIREPFSNENRSSLQDCLKDPQMRSLVRKRLRDG